MKKNILFLIGSLNQTTQMHQISKYLSDSYACFFSQVFANHPVLKTTVNLGLLDYTVLAGERKIEADKYLQTHNLKNDYRCEVYENEYDLVVACTDIIIPECLKRKKIIWVQEGMIDELTPLARITHFLKLPRYLAIGTALNGASNICDIYCAASEGYKQHLVGMGTDASKIVVTGVPNLDNAASYLKNDFPIRDYVMVATSDIRECFRYDDRIQFIQKAVAIANGRKLLFKLHPNEKKGRAIREIERNTPGGTEIFTSGNAEHMVANCSELITQYSTLAYIGILLGKKVHSYFDIEKLKRLAPLQNAGTSAKIIAEICRGYIEYKGTGKDFLNQFNMEHSEAPYLANAI
jgi:hypothetical protein